jgi:Tfp pilus assembly protein PilF
VVRKTNAAKWENQIAKSEVENKKLENELEMERQKAHLRETELLGNLERYEEANKALEERVAELESSKGRITKNFGTFLDKMLGYKKALKKVNEFTKRNSDGHIGGPTARGGFPFWMSGLF